MDIRAASLDWSLVRSFLAIAEAGSLSAAARRLGISQPTLGRHVRQIEAALGAEPFVRHARGLELSDTGRALLPAAGRMRAAAGDFALAAAGRDRRLDGTVRITASEMVSHHILPRIVAAIRAETPDLALDLVPTDRTGNLAFREADIAIRMFRPTQLDIVTRHLGDIRLGLFAATSYIARRGRPSGPSDLAGHDLVGYDRADDILRGLRALGLPATRDWFKVRCDDQVALWELVRAGCGVGFGQVELIRADPSVELIDLGVGLPVLPVWLAAPAATRRTPRIDHVWRHLERGLAAFVS